MTYSNLFVADATARPGTDAATLEAAMVTEIYRPRFGGVLADEVERVLALVESDFVTSIQTAGDRADAISKFATLLGDPALVNEQLSRYRKVTAGEVSAFARDFLGEDNRATLVYQSKAEGVGEGVR